LGYNCIVKVNPATEGIFYPRQPLGFIQQDQGSDCLSQDGIAYRRYARVETNSIVVSLTSAEDPTPVSGFLRDISEGGMKIQKIAVDREVRLGGYHCQLILSGFGKLQAEIEVVGFGSEEDKYSKQIVRMRFTRIDPESKDKLKKFIEQKMNNNG
jgi:c-di-GMP-binding flagellar brake protein YcgR